MSGQLFIYSTNVGHILGGMSGQGFSGACVPTSTEMSAQAAYMQAIAQADMQARRHQLLMVNTSKYDAFLQAKQGRQWKEHPEDKAFHERWRKCRGRRKRRP